MRIVLDICAETVSQLHTWFICSCHHWRCQHTAPLLAVQDLHYIVKNRANKRERLSILSGVSGYFNPGEMAAVMGPSGSGAAATPAALNISANSNHRLATTNKCGLCLMWQCQASPRCWTCWPRARPLVNARGRSCSLGCSPAAPSSGATQVLGHLPVEAADALVSMHFWHAACGTLQCLLDRVSVY